MLSPLDTGAFAVTVEVVPPAGFDADPLLDALGSLGHLPIAGYSVAANPVAKPRMSALALSALIQQETGRPCVLHCTTRDHNRLSSQSLLWGARALDVESVLITTGDYVALGDRARTTAVRDLDVYALVELARESGLNTGVVLDPRPESGRLEHEVRRLQRKVQAGAQFAVTQPVYGEDAARLMYSATKALDIPVILGILPLHSARHAEFLHQEVAGIAVPEGIQQRLQQAADARLEGVAIAREMLSMARQWFAGACIMPAFNHYDVLENLL
jgi:methylenetetrahydrofolate reductase (NADPH)